MNLLLLSHKILTVVCFLNTPTDSHSFSLIHRLRSHTQILSYKFSHTENSLSHTESSLSHTHRTVSHTELSLTHKFSHIILPHTELSLTQIILPLSHTELSLIHRIVSHTENFLTHRILSLNTQNCLSYRIVPLTQILLHTEFSITCGILSHREFSPLQTSF